MKIARFVIIVIAFLSAWMAFDNVLSDDEPTRAMAEKIACGVKKCEERHSLVKVSRTPIGESLDYEWRDGIVHIRCQRAYFVIGERVCQSE